jgi:hypothetical protein
VIPVFKKSLTHKVMNMRLNLVQFCALAAGLILSAGSAVADIGSFFGRSPELIAEFRVAVHWQMTRARFDRYGNASDSESFQESWKLEVFSDGQAFLATHRQRVPVTVEPAVPASGRASVRPNVLIVQRNDMALLLGLSAIPEIGAGANILRSGDSQLRLNIGDAKAAVPVTFDGPDDEHVAIRLNVGELQQF